MIEVKNKKGFDEHSVNILKKYLIDDDLKEADSEEDLKMEKDGEED